MPTLDVSRAEWSEFLAAFSGQHDGWLISLDRVDADARPRHREGALRGIAIDAATDSTIAVRIDDEETGRRETERVERPRRITLEQTPGRIDAGLQIDAADGRITLRFRHPIRPELVDGVAPG
jgi:hypothetical protein